MSCEIIKCSNGHYRIYTEDGLSSEEFIRFIQNEIYLNQNSRIISFFDTEINNRHIIYFVLNTDGKKNAGMCFPQSIYSMNVFDEHYFDLMSLSDIIGYEKILWCRYPEEYFDKLDKMINNSFRYFYMNISKQINFLYKMCRMDNVSVQIDGITYPLKIFNLEKIIDKMICRMENSIFIKNAHNIDFII